MNIAATLTAPLARYAERFHGAVGNKHHVASPLGAWLLLALCGPASTGSLREQLTAALGLDVEVAATLAATLLGSCHPLVGAGAAVWWTHAQTNAEALAGWMAGLPAGADRGDLPTPAELDAWAKERTLGLIEKFPQLPPGPLLVLATALATKVLWDQPFDLAPARDLGAASPWVGRVNHVLRTPRGGAVPRTPLGGHRQFVAATERAGDVAVHTASAQDGLAVTSVIATPDVSPSDVLAVAYDLATVVACGGHVARRSLFDLPLGDGPLWTLTEKPIMTTARDRREEYCTAVLPAWSASSDHDLSTDALGFPAAAAALFEILGVKLEMYAASQSVLAKYSRIGFEAAAITGVRMLGAPPRKRAGVCRVAELRFGHPYAVVAVATDDRSGALISSLQTNGPWHGVPVFSAWRRGLRPRPTPTTTVVPAGQGNPGVAGRRNFQKNPRDRTMTKPTSYLPVFT